MLIIENNTAEYAGDAIFGGSIQYCQQLESKVSHHVSILVSSVSTGAKCLLPPL